MDEDGQFFHLVIYFSFITSFRIIISTLGIEIETLICLLTFLIFEQLVIILDMFFAFIVFCGIVTGAYTVKILIDDDDRDAIFYASAAMTTACCISLVISFIVYCLCNLGII